MTGTSTALRRRRSLRHVLTALGCALMLVLAGSTASGAATTTVVTLTFDNNTISQYTLGWTQALQPHGMNATFYVNSGTIAASKNFLSWSQLQDLAAAGNEIGGKTVDGKVNLKTSTDNQAKVDEVCNDRQALIQHGFAADAFAYPFGAFDATAESIVQTCGYGTARAGGGVSPTGALYAETLPPKDYYATRPYGPAGQVTLANLETMVTNAAAHGGGWDQVIIQKVCSQALDPTNYATCTTSSGYIELSDLNTFLDWVQSAGQTGGAPAGTVIKTVAQAVAPTDTTAPATGITCNGAACASSTYHGTVYVTLSPTDSGSGVSSTHYTLDGSDPTLSSPTYTGTFPVTDSATVKFRSWDYAGNVEATNSQALQVVEEVDTTPPVTTIACNGSPCSASPYMAPVTVTLTPTDNPSGWGVDKTYYTTDGSAPTTSSQVYTGPFTVKQNTTVKFFSTDLAGNAEPVNTQEIDFQVVISLTFDDGDDNQYTVGYLHALQPHGLHGTFYIITGVVGQDSSMTWGQIGALDAAGNDIGGHTVDHINLKTTTDYQTKVNEVCNNRQDLINHGLWPVDFAYPEGAYDATAEQIVQSCGFSTARAAGGIDINGTGLGPAYAETVPPKDPWATRTVYDDTQGGATTLAHLQNSVTAAEQNGGGWLTFVFHQICSQTYEPATYTSCMSDYGPTDLTVLNGFLDWLQSPSGPSNITFKTVAQVMHPGTPPPAPVITDNPPSFSGSSTASFSFTDAQSGVSFQCSVDGIGSQCASPFTTAALTDGTHTFTVKARDANGNVSDGTSYTWTSDTTSPPPPVFTNAHAGKLVTIVFENESHPAILGSSSAPYLNQLISNGELFSNYYAVDTDGSFPNYLAMVSGDTAALPVSPNIFQAIDATNGAVTWKEFMESMSGTCGSASLGNVPGTTDALYTQDHDPGANFGSNISCATNDVPLTSSALNAANLPDFSYMVPNECDDMHTLPTSGQACPAYFGSNSGTNSVNMADNWLAHVVPSLLAQPNVTVLITFDEGGLDQGEHITTLAVGAGVVPGSSDSTRYDHYSLEAGLYGYFGLGPAPGQGATATPLPIPGLGGDVPKNPSNDPQPSFGFSDPEPSDSFKCSIDNGAYSACTSPYQTPPLSDGQHTFSVEAVDSVGNASAPRSYTWTVKTTPPASPTFTSTPTDPTNQATATFGFSAPSGTTVECSLDGAAYAACTSPVTTGTLADGQHTFGVRARDTAGNTSAPAVYSWMVKVTAPPAPSLNSTPPNPSNVSKPTFAFSDSATGVTFACAIDGGAFSACTSPFTTPTLVDGSHTFAVRAVDAVGNTSTATQYTWRIDTVAPPIPSLTSNPPATSAGKTGTFGFTDTEAGVAFECQVDAAAFAACVSPFTTPTLADGTHTFAVRARDAAGNASSARSYTWRIDTTPPGTPTGFTASVTSHAVVLGWNASTATDLAGYNVYRSASATGPYTKLNASLLTTTSYQDTAAPAVTTSFYQVEAVDQLGNRSTPAQLSIKRGIAFRSAATAAATLSTSITVGKPSGTANGDVLVATIDIAGTTTVTAPSGWTLVRSTTSGSSLMQATYVHAAGASEPSSYVWRFSSLRTASAIMAAYIGVNRTTPVDVSSGGSSTGSTSVTAPSVTTTASGELLVGVFGAAANASVTPPSGMIEEAERLGGTGTNRALSELSDQQVGAGATGTRTAALSRSGANVGQLVALRPSQ